MSVIGGKTIICCNISCKFIDRRGYCLIFNENGCIFNENVVITQFIMFLRKNKITFFSLKSRFFEKSGLNWPK